MFDFAAAVNADKNSCNNKRCGSQRCRSLRRRSCMQADQL